MTSTSEAEAQMSFSDKLFSVNYWQTTSPFTLAFSLLGCFIALYNLTIDYIVPTIKKRTLQRLTKIDMYKQAAWMFLLIHASSGAYTVVKLDFSPLSIAILFISCATSLVFNVMVLLILKSKLVAVAPHETWVNIGSVAVIAMLKFAAFTFLLTITLFEDRSFWVKTIGLTGRALNMAGNSLFVAYIDYSTIRYSQFLFENLARKANSKEIDAWMLKKFYAGFAVIAILGLINFILMIIQFFVEWLHHSLVISITSFTTAILIQFHNWLDDIFLRGIGKFKNLSVPEEIEFIHDQQGPHGQDQEVPDDSVLSSKQLELAMIFIDRVALRGLESSPIFDDIRKQ